MKFEPVRSDDLALYKQIKNKVYIQYIKNFRKERKNTRNEYIEILKDETTLPKEIIKHILNYVPIPAKKPLPNTELCNHILREYIIAYRIKHVS